MVNTEEQDSFLFLLMEACEAVADEVGAWLRNPPPSLQQDPIPGERIELFVSQLGSLFKSMVRLTKTRVLEAVKQGQRALAIRLDGTQPDNPVALAASYARIGNIQQRLGEHKGLARLFNEYVLFSEGEACQLLFPPIQQAFAQATKTPSGTYILAESPDGLSRVTLGIEYPAYHLYDLMQRPVAEGPWQPVDRTGRNQLVALLANAYHKGYWFARQADVAWRPS